MKLNLYISQRNVFDVEDLYCYERLLLKIIISESNTPCFYVAIHHSLVLFYFLLSEYSSM
jgi:hypothetical protein